MFRADGLEFKGAGHGEAVLPSHGGQIADGFLPLMRQAALCDRYRFIRYRRRGDGGSDPGAGAFEVEEQAHDARALLSHLGEERCCVS